MEPDPTNPPVPESEWPTATKLRIPEQHDKIEQCSPDEKRKALKTLRAEAQQQLDSISEELLRHEASAFRKMLEFASAILIATTRPGGPRDAINTLVDKHTKNKMFPSLATIYRCETPLRVWLSREAKVDAQSGRKGKTKTKLTRARLRKDGTPLLLLTAENFERIIAEYKTWKTFCDRNAEEHRPRAGNRDDDELLTTMTEESDQPETTDKDSEATLQAVVAEVKTRIPDRRKAVVITLDRPIDEETLRAIRSAAGPGATVTPL